MDGKIPVFSQAIRAKNYSAICYSGSLTRLCNTSLKHFKGKICHFGVVILPQSLIVPRKGDNQRIVLASISHRAQSLGKLGPL